MTDLANSQFYPKTILFISHKQTNCGVHQFGCDVAQVLESSQRYRFIYRECDCPEGLFETVRRDAPDAIIYNWHSTTLAWLTGPIVWITETPSVAVIHEIDSTTASAMSNDIFESPARLPIGSFGFAAPGKGFEALVALINE